MNTTHALTIGKAVAGLNAQSKGRIPGIYKTQIARLAALVPTGRVHLTRYQGVFTPPSAWRAKITQDGPCCAGFGVQREKLAGRGDSVGGLDRS